MLTSILLREVKESNSLLVQTGVPADRNVLLGLRLLKSLVIVRLQLHKWTEDVLVLVGILVTVCVHVCVCVCVCERGVRMHV